eukprot:14269313-Alexandrium_andersonii.AAC.1
MRLAGRGATAELAQVGEAQFSTHDGLPCHIVDSTSFAPSKDQGHSPATLCFVASRCRAKHCWFIPACVTRLAFADVAMPPLENNTEATQQSHFGRCCATQAYPHHSFLPSCARWTLLPHKLDNALLFGLKAHITST